MDLDLRVTVIGSSSFVPTLLTSWSSFFVNLGKGDSVLVDAGSYRLLSIRKDVLNVKQILITHRHPDHTLFIGGLLRRMKRRKRTEPLTIISPPNAYHRLHQYIRYFNPGGVPSFATLRVFTPGNPRQIGYLPSSKTEILAAAACHTTTAIGYAVRQGNTKVVIAPDTTPNCPTLLKLAKNATAFFHDCTFPSRLHSLARRKGHSSPEGCGYDAKQSDVENLVLIHLSRPRNPDVKKVVSGARSRFNGKIIVARDNATYDF